MAIKEVLSDNRNVVVPFPASVAVTRGNLLFWDNTNKYANNASSRTDLGALVANQRDFAQNFLGVAQDQRISTETSTGNDSRRNVVLDGIFDCDTLSTTYEIGDLVGIDRNSGTPANYNTQVAKVSNPCLAIGSVVVRGTSLTTVRVRLTSNLFFSIPENSNSVLGGQGQGSTALADSAVTVTVDQGPFLTMVPTAARNVTLPNEAISKGLEFLFTNNSAGSFSVTFKASDGATAIKGNGVVPQNKCCRLWCDGTNWNGLVSS